MTASGVEAGLDALRARIDGRTAHIAVIGLGYVGLPLAATFAQAGFRVTGVDIDATRVATINRGECPIEGNEPGLAVLLGEQVAAGRLRATTDYALLHDADVITLNVETPVDADHTPRYGSLRAACAALGPVLGQGAIVVCESTVSPGTTRDLVAPELERTSGRNLGEGFHVGACPERVMPGRLLANIRNVPRAVGGSSPQVAATLAALYRTIVVADVDVVDTTSAEMAKVVENAYRDVQIAFANEVATICDALGIDVWKIRELVNKVPMRDMHRPGVGVGGHCIPKDPWLLAHAGGGQVPLRLIPAARAVNDAMPRHVSRLVLDALDRFRKEHDVHPDAPRSVAVLGVTYLADSDDTRNSPSLALIAELEAAGCDVHVHDPYVAPYRDGSVATAVAKADVVLVAVPHREYAGLALDEFVAAEEFGTVVALVRKDKRG